MSRARKRMFGWTIAISSPFIAGVLYYCSLYFLYVPSEEFPNFPVPRYAKLVKETELSKSYDWPGASEENGIPFGYEIILKKNGWEKGEREGASVVYSKGSNKIDLISTTKHLIIRPLYTP